MRNIFGRVMEKTVKRRWWIVAIVTIVVIGLLIWLGYWNLTLKIIRDNSNLLLVIITVVYVVLTWRMVSEMKYAREAEAKPYLVATVVPLGAKIIQLRVQNVGRGPALDIDATIRLEPAYNKKPLVPWQHPALFPNQFQDFKFGDEVPELDKLSEKYEKVISYKLECRLQSALLWAE